MMKGTAVELAATRTHLFRAGSKKVWPDTDSDDCRRIRQVECARKRKFWLYRADCFANG